MFKDKEMLINYPDLTITCCLHVLYWYKIPGKYTQFFSFKKAELKQNWFLKQADFIGTGEQTMEDMDMNHSGAEDWELREGLFGED